MVVKKNLYFYNHEMLYYNIFAIKQVNVIQWQAMHLGFYLTYHAEQANQTLINLYNFLVVRVTKNCLHLDGTSMKAMSKY